VRAGPKLLRLRVKIDEDITAADVLSFWMDCAFVSGRTAAHCIPGCWAGLYHWMLTALPLDDAKVRTEFGVVDRLAALDAFHSMPEYYSKFHPYFQNIVWNDGKVDVLDNLLRGVHDEVVVRLYDPSTGALAPHKYEFTRELVEAIRDGGSSGRVQLSRENPTVRAFLKDWARLSLKLEVPATGLRYKDRGETWMLTEDMLRHLFSGRFEKDGAYGSTLMGGIRYALFGRDAEGVVKKVLDKGSFLERDVGARLRATAARDAACESEAARDAARRYDATCARWIGSPYPPPLPDDAAIEAARRVAADRAKAEAARRSLGPRRRASRHGVEVVPPEAGATTYFVGVHWDISKRFWKACYKRWKGPLSGPNYGHVPGTYPTNQRTARARYDCIQAKGLQQFNDMDALDDATDLMVPREKKPPKKRPRSEPVGAALTRRSSRARTAVSED